MYHLRHLAKNVAHKKEIANSAFKFLPITLTPSRNYADHQIPDRLKDVGTAKGMLIIRPINFPIMQFMVIFISLI